MTISSDQKRITEKHLFQALRNQDWERFVLCLKKGADINARTATQQTPLMLAIHFSHAKWVAPMIERGADILAKDIDGKTAFDYANSITYADLRKGITDTLLNALPDADKNTAQNPATETPEEKKSITPMKPLTYAPKKKNGPSGGFRL